MATGRDDRETRGVARAWHGIQGALDEVRAGVEHRVQQEAHGRSCGCVLVSGLRLLQLLGSQPLEREGLRRLLPATPRHCATCTTHTRTGEGDTRIRNVRVECSSTAMHRAFAGSQVVSAHVPSRRLASTPEERKANTGVIAHRDKGRGEDLHAALAQGAACDDKQPTYLPR